MTTDVSLGRATSPTEGLPQDQETFDRTFRRDQATCAELHWYRFGKAVKFHTTYIKAATPFRASLAASLFVTYV